MNRLILAFIILTAFGPGAMAQTNKIQSLSLPQYIELHQGESKRIIPEVVPSDAYESIEWESDYSGQYTIENDGTITACFSENEGADIPIILTVHTTDGSNLTARSRIIKKYDTPTSIIIDHIDKDVMIHAGEYTSFKALLLPENGFYSHSYYWSIDGTYQYVSGDKIDLQFPASGSYTVGVAYVINDETTTDESGEIITIPGYTLTDECALEVGAPVTGALLLSANKLIMKPEQKFVLGATPVPNDGIREYELVSENTNVATVSDNGIVEAIAPGKTQIVATIVGEEAPRAICKVEVKEKSALEPESGEILMNDGAVYEFELNRVQAIYVQYEPAFLTLYFNDDDIVSFNLADIQAINYRSKTSGVNDVVLPQQTISVEGNDVLISNIDLETEVRVYDISGKTILVTSSSRFTLPTGIYVITIGRKHVYKIKI